MIRKIFYFLLLLFISITVSGIHAETMYFEQDPDISDYAEKIKEAVEKADWKTAAGFAERLLSKPDKMGVLCQEDERHYIALSEFLARQIAGWPQDVREQLAERLNETASGLSSRAKNIADWESIARYYPFCEAGLKAHFRVAEIALENGDFGRAAFWWERAAKMFKLEPAKNPHLFAMLAFSRAGTGDLSGARELIAQIEKLGNVKAVYEGREIDIPSFIKYIKAAIEKMRLGAADANAASGAGFPVPQKPSLTIPMPAYYWLDSIKENYKDGNELPMIEQRATIIGGRLYCSNAKSLRAFDLATGKQIWLYGDKDDPSPTETMTMGRPTVTVQSSPGGIMDIMQYGGKLLINMGRILNAKNFRADNTNLNTKIHAIDLDGKRAWRTYTNKNDDRFYLRNLILLNLPASSSGYLYATAVPLKSPIELHMVCLNGDTGRVEWHKFLWSLDLSGTPNPAKKGLALMPRFVMGRRGGQAEAPSMGDDPAPLSDGSTVYIVSRLGGIAAYDSSNGNPIWVYNYKWSQPPSQYWYRNMQAGWTVNPAILWRHLLFAAPSNAEELFALDKMTGKTIWTFPRGKYNYVLGTHNDKLIITGEKVTALDAASGKELWSKDLGAKPFGRGCIYNGIIYHPAYNGLYLLKADDGTVLHTMKWDNPFEQAGNVVITGGKLVICGFKSISVYDSAISDKK